MLNKAAQFISTITHPIFLFFYILIFLLFKSELFIGILQMYKIWLIITYLIVNTICIPLILIYFFEREFNIKDKENRILPYFIMLIIYFLIYLFFHKFHFPVILNKFLLSIIFLLAVLFILNFLLKISMHTASAGSCISLFLYLYLMYPEDFFEPLLVVLVLAGLIGSARLRLKVHTNLELYSGYFVGFLITTLVLFT